MTSSPPTRRWVGPARAPWRTPRHPTRTSRPGCRRADAGTGSPPSQDGSSHRPTAITAAGKRTDVDEWSHVTDLPLRYSRSYFADPGCAKHAADRLRRTGIFADPGSAKHAADRLRRTGIFADPGSAKHAADLRPRNVAVASIERMFDNGADDARLPTFGTVMRTFADV